LTGAIPPIRIILSNIDKPDWVPFNDIKALRPRNILLIFMTRNCERNAGRFLQTRQQYYRAEFMVLLVKALKLQGPAENIAGFTDIDGHWAKDIILVAAKHGLISGYEDGT